MIVIVLLVDFVDAITICCLANDRDINLIGRAIATFVRTPEPKIRTISTGQCRRYCQGLM